MSARPVPPGTAPPFEPQGLAWRAFLDGRRGAAVQVHCADGESEAVPAADGFRGPADFEPWERAALARCVGRVLDVGAGAGCHALALQAAGHAVLALDVCPHACAVLRERGVREVLHGTLAVVPDGAADTALMLQHGSGLAGDVAGLRAWLGELARVLRPGGRLLLDGRGPDHLDPAELAATPDARHPGVAELWMSFDGVVGAPFRWLFLEWQRCARLAVEAGWRAERVWADDDGRWVGSLRRG